MGAEQSKAAKRRFADGAFHLRYFAGHGLDVGGKPDPLGKYVGAFARLLSCRTWDLDDGTPSSWPGCRTPAWTSSTPATAWSTSATRGRG